MKKSVQNLEQFLAARALNFKVVIGPRYEPGVEKGKASEDRFYIYNSSLEKLKSVRSVWKKGEWSPAVLKANKELDIHGTKTIYSHDIGIAKKIILADGEKAYNAYLIRQKRGFEGELEMEDTSKNFEKMLKELKS